MSEPRPSARTAPNDVHELSLFSAAGIRASRPGRCPVLLPDRGNRFLRGADRRPGVGVRREVPSPPWRRSRRSDPRLPGAGAPLDHHSARHLHGDVRVGRAGVLPHDAAAEGGDGDLRRRQAVDVEGAAHGRRQRDQRAARADRASREAGDGLRGRHPQLLHSGFPREGRRHPWTLQHHVVHGEQAGEVPHLLHAGTAAPNTPP